MLSRRGTARRIAGVIASCIGIGIMLFPAPASAGRLLATGHDADHHCGRATGVSDAQQQCHFFQVALDYVRAGAPDPTKPVLVLDRGELDVVSAIDRVYGPALPRVVIEPRSRAFVTTPITTALYSAVVIASSRGPATDPSPQDLNEFASTPDSDAINARADDLRAFYGAGGGLYVNSGNDHGDGPDDPYYAFLPVTVQGAQVRSPFLLTDPGRALGFVDKDITCCPTHNTFEPFAEGSALRTIDRDSAGRIVSVFAETQRFSELAEPPLTPATRKEIAAGVPASNAPKSSTTTSPTTSTTGCARRTLILRLRRSKGLRFSRANFFVRGKFVKRHRGARITKPIKVKLPSTRTGRVSVRIVIYTTGKRRLTIKRTYKTCASR